MCIPPKAKKTRTVGPLDGHTSDEDSTDRGSETLSSLEDKALFEIDLQDDDDKKQQVPFVLATYEMVIDPQNSTAVGFSANGTVLEIRDVSKFCHDVLPKYFRHNNFSSFVRQLNMYRFEKLRCVPRVEHAFRHQFFLRDQPTLLEKVIRKASPRHRRSAASMVPVVAPIIVAPLMTHEEVEKLQRMQKLNAEYTRALEWRNAQLREEQARLHNVMSGLVSSQERLNEINRLFESPVFNIASVDLALLDGVQSESRCTPVTDPFANALDFDLGSFGDLDDSVFLNDLLA